MTYALPIREPRTKKEGLLNFVQMIINAAERGDTREATLLAVDLKDTLDGEANPFKDLTDGFTKDAVVKEVAEARRQMAESITAKVQEAYAKGAADERARILRTLQTAEK